MNDFTAFRPAAAPLFAILWLTTLFAACDSPTVAPSSSEAWVETPLLGLPEPPQLLVCPSNETVSTSALITPLGGSLTLAGHQLDVPAGALQLPVLINLTEPASKFVEVSVSVVGVDHFLFQLPVTLTLSYERCGRSNIDRESIQAWHIDEVTKALLENMGGLDDKDAHTVTFSTGHFSGYALAQ